VYKSISGTRDLPAFLVKNPGLNSGFMITQYACAAIVSQNKQLCSPASVDTIDSSNGQEDHVSMGANAATKLYRIIENCYSILGIELFHAVQGLSLRRPLKSSETIEKLYTKFTSEVSGIIEKDEYMHPKLKKSALFVKQTTF
jgi:histidine ammonia-lyase